MDPRQWAAQQCLDGLRGHGIDAVRLRNDSRQVRRGDVFVAYPGERLDGRDFIAAAIANGAAAVLWERQGFEWQRPWQVANIGMPGLRDLAGEIAALAAGEPARDLLMIGVTGTNGKTSCSHWIAAALSAAGRRSAVIGTLGHGFLGALEGLANTTPDALALHPLLARYRREGACCVAMEASSHGLVQGRLSGARFDIALFTNLTRDHLDYHGDMVRYGEAKARLFKWPGLGCAVINIDDAFGRSLVGRLNASRAAVLTYGLTGGTVAGTRLDLHRFGLELEIRTPWGEGVVRSPLFGAHNAANLLGVVSVLIAADVPFGQALEALERLAPVEGRMQTLGGDDKPLVIIDYAHTPDALEQALTSLRRHFDAGRLVCVFGCGGERDAGKRPLMGQAASRLADEVVITSDNPRAEDPAAIIAEIAAGARPPLVLEPDRGRAIAGAIAGAQREDVVLVAGKGHEPYQEIAGVRHSFSDAAVSRLCLDRWPERVPDPLTVGARA
ncbi:MAG: UDP-N-acetylmuramoyl-L-alanyl-D-glutamate--2,6-diaminopimelate ligase [Betaproteobacteria bacterium]|nr:UDP-N-acetylmuramoyl-L-alanyl-D-glutamate--2,6-diaminopimelate ligase [Betaproteobacteria bacterium]